MGEADRALRDVIEAARRLSPSAICDLDRRAAWRWRQVGNYPPNLVGTYPYADVATFIRAVLRALPSEGQWWDQFWDIADDEPVKTWVTGGGEIGTHD